MKIKRQGYSYNLMLKKIPNHIITEQKSIPIPAAHPCTANYRKLLPRVGEVLCSTENSPFLLIDHIHAKINRVCCAALAIGKKCMNVRKNKLFNSRERKSI